MACDNCRGARARSLQGTGLFVPPPLVKTVEKIVEVPRIEYVPQVQFIEKIVEVPKVQVVEPEVEKISEVILSVSVEHFAAQADERVIAAEVALFAPDAAHRQDFNTKVSAHQAAHPHGMLPRGLRGFEEYMKVLQKNLDSAQQARVRCLSCGKFPWQYPDT